MINTIYCLLLLIGIVIGVTNAIDIALRTKTINVLFEQLELERQNGFLHAQRAKLLTENILELRTKLEVKNGENS